MSERTILHCDLNNFFASVSLLSNQTLYDMPVAVCGSSEDRHGIVLAKNEIAKKQGVKTAEVIWEAKRKCPELVTLPPDYKKYSEYSEKAKAIYSRYTDLIEPFGIDECWLDVTASKRVFGNGEEIAEKIRKAIKGELGITVSVGVSFNKVFAKLGSDMKKPDAVTVISKENFKEKIWGLPVGDLLFVGKKSVDALNRIGVFTIGDLAYCDEQVMKKLMGVSGIEIRNYALGLDSSPVCPLDYHYIPKSVGRSVTPKNDIENRDEVWKIYLQLSEDISRTLHKDNLYATGITVHLRTSTLKVKEISKSFSGGTNCAITLAKKAMDLFDASYNFEMPLRSVGFRAINLKNKNDFAVQQDLFGICDNEEKNENIEESIMKVRTKFGNQSIKRARTV